MGFRLDQVHPTKKEKEALYGKGTKRWLFRQGLSRTTAKSDLTQSEVEALEIASGGSLLSTFQLDMSGFPTATRRKGDLPTILKLRGVQFTE